MISLQYDLTSESENVAFFGAFFKFVEAAEVNDADAISIRSAPDGAPGAKVVTFEDEAMARNFRTYWDQRRKWLGL